MRQKKTEKDGTELLWFHWAFPPWHQTTTNFDLLSQKREREDKNNLTCVSQLLNA
jgi:hypothetical protein